MMITQSLRRLLLSIVIIAMVGYASNYFVRNTTISSISIFDTISLFTYFGVLIGFALTVYTFGLTMIPGIKQKIEENNKINEEQKKELYNTLVRGFGQIKEDIWLIFFSIVVIIFFSVAKEVPNTFGWRVEYLMLPETVNLTLFITSTIAMWDIIQSLFNLSEINFVLNK